MFRTALCILLVLLAACGAPPPEQPAATVLPDQFPGPMKGLILYGWVRGGETYFTLVTGTNRLKTFEELDAAEPLVGADGWVRVRVAGVERALDLVKRAPPESLAMIETIRHVSVAQSTVPPDVGVPEDEALATLRRHAEESR